MIFLDNVGLQNQRKQKGLGTGELGQEGGFLGPENTTNTSLILEIMMLEVVNVCDGLDPPLVQNR